MGQVIIPDTSIIIGLSVILICVLVLPFIIKKIEYNLEVFLFISGIIAVTLSGLWSVKLIISSIISPVHPKHPIVEAVFLAGIFFTFFRKKIDSLIKQAENTLGARLFVFALVFVLGIISSVITAIIATLALVEIVTILKFDRKTRNKIVILACFSIGLGAALTPVGEPLSTILVSRLADEPYNAGFFFLVKLLAIYIVPAVILFSAIAAFYANKEVTAEKHIEEKNIGAYKDIFIRSGKIYLFVMALELLAKGFSPAVDYLIPAVRPEALYWINMISAILDNATLTAAEITPKMGIIQIKAMLIGLLISGGMLIPGNIPNIIASAKLKITSREWAAVGIPFGLSALIIYYLILFVF